ncbi:uncharacterized protein LOC117337377 [Pecten maximus]|uniref:uncharacterized protein LOC117337377 n=1 Tax=Pecten maximus TaxID=6579 RepID=UPI001458771B|nr:uncharacterized protein LOC117337377 [Pecten maximus]
MTAMMAAIVVNFLLIICVCNCFGFLEGTQIDPRYPPQPRQDLDPGNEPKHWQDLVSFVNQKIEGMERLQAEKDKRVDKLESKVASQERSILQKDVIIDSLVRRVSDLEMSVGLKPDTGNQKTRQNEKSDTDFSTANVDNSDQNRSVFNDTANVHKTVELFTSGNKPQTAPRSIPYAGKLFNANRRVIQSSPQTEAAVVPVDEFSTSRQNRVAVPMSAKAAFHTAISGNKGFKTGAVVVFDHETLDHGSGYNPSDGLYTVPESGTYVLTWTIISNTHEEFNTLLIVNGAVMGASFSDTSGVGDYHTSSATVVLTLNEDDHVFIRMGITALESGYIISTANRYGLCTFSGWNID